MATPKKNPARVAGGVARWTATTEAEAASLRAVRSAAGRQAQRGPALARRIVSQWQLQGPGRLTLDERKAVLQILRDGGVQA